MNARIWKIAAALCLAVSAVGCKQDSGRSPAPAGPTLTLTPSTTSVVANGTNTVTFSVTDTGAVAVTLTTNRGTFTGGVTSVVIPAGTGATTGTVTLVTCDSGTNVGCAGAASVTASSTSGSATASINFTSLASACSSNCGAATGCAGLACTLPAGGTGSCSATSPSACTAAPACTKNPANATTETDCTDGIDNDCNGDKDCEDAACAGVACDPASTTSVCKAGACTDLASGLAIAVLPTRTRLPANGTTTTTVVVAVTSNQEAAPSMGVTISTTLGTLSAPTGTTGADGTVTFTFTAPATAGVAVITASATAVPTVTASASITMPRLGSFQVPANYAVPPIMGVLTSGWNELGAVQVQVLDDQGQAYPDGLAVHFEHRKLGGSTFGAPTAACAGATPPANCSAYDAAISGGAGEADKTGLARAPLFSGTVAGTLVVTATTTASGVTRDVTLPGIAVVGAKASLANFSIQCGPRNVPALAETDCSTSWVEAQITCAAILKDRFNNLLGTSTQVIFASEAAAVGQVTWTPPYDPASEGTGQADLGTATQIFQTLGAGLPFDVTPFGKALVPPTEPWVDHGIDGCGTRTHNPRDGVATIIAIADGEEGFFDANGNGAYDREAFTDANGNGVWDVGEQFIDANGNGVYDQEPFVDQGEPFIDQDDDGAWDPGEWYLDVDGSGDYTVGNGTWEANAKIWTQTVVVYTGYATTMNAPPATPGLLGTRWVSGAFSDACTPTPPAAPFAVLAKRAGPPEVPPTSVGEVVVASDWNLNRLTSGTTYKVGVVGAGKVKATYFGLASYADALGMFYQYWPCDQTGACASQCRATGAGAPCEMTPAISGFSCGIEAGVTITGGDTPDGTNVVEFLVDTPYSVYLGEKVIRSGSTTVGTNN